MVLIAESLVDVILLVPQAERAQLMAHMLSALGDSPEEQPERKRLRINPLVMWSTAEHDDRLDNL